jgi:DNA (cytosine-5)-methyltransferase 1
MNDTYGLTLPPPSAFFDPESSSWKMCGVMFPSDYPESSQTFPASGMTRGGELFELPMLVPPISGQESSSSLPTPTCDDANNVTRNSGAYQSLTRAAMSLLPTPTTQDGSNTAGPSQMERNSLPLNTLVTLLPTPRAGDGEKGGPNQHGSKGDLMLPSAVMQLLPTPNPFHMGNNETPDEWLARRAEVQDRTGTRHGPALPVVAKSVAQGTPLYQAGDGPTLWSGDRTNPQFVDGKQPSDE